MESYNFFFFFYEFVLIKRKKNADRIIYNKNNKKKEKITLPGAVARRGYSVAAAKNGVYIFCSFIISILNKEI